MGHKDEQYLTLPDYIGRNNVDILVKRPEWSLMMNTEYDFSGLTNVVLEVFEGRKTRKNNRKNTSEEDEKIMFLIEDLCREAMIEPTFDLVNTIHPLRDEHKMIILNWIFEDIELMKDFIKNKNLMFPLILQCKNFRKFASDIFDPTHRYTQMYKSLFDKAVAEYWAYLENEKEPLENFDRKGPNNFLNDIPGAKMVDNSILNRKNKNKDQETLEDKYEILARNAMKDINQKEE